MQNAIVYKQYKQTTRARARERHHQAAQRHPGHFSGSSSRGPPPRCRVPTLATGWLAFGLAHYLRLSLPRLPWPRWRLPTPWTGACGLATGLARTDVSGRRTLHRLARQCDASIAPGPLRQFLVEIAHRHFSRGACGLLACRAGAALDARRFARTDLVGIRTYRQLVSRYGCLGVALYAWTTVDALDAPCGNGIFPRPPAFLHRRLWHVAVLKEEIATCRGPHATELQA